MEKMVTPYFTLSILFPMFGAVSTKFCTGIDGKLTCCQSYKLDFAKNICIPCDAGFIGINCVTKCPYPAYGKGCQSLCDCNVTTCHHVNGCIQFSDYQIPSTVHMSYMYRPVTKELMAIDNISSNENFSNITSDNTTNFNTPFCDTKERQSKGISTLMFGTIGLTALSFIIYMMYLYTRVLENRRVNTSTV